MSENVVKLPLDEGQILDVVRRVIAGDKSAFSSIVLNFQDQIYALVLAQVGDQAMAKDIAQDTFIRAYKYLGTFKGDSLFKTWLVRIALNNIKSYFTSSAYKKKQRSDSFKTSEHEQIISSETSEENKFSEELLGFMRQEISQLKEIYKDVLVRRAFNGMSYQEISKELDIPVGTVSSRMNAALLVLRSKLSEVR
jgi:RNA polymerase sigma-70 factor (ECF subfamily)